MARGGMRSLKVCSLLVLVTTALLSVGCATPVITGAADVDKAAFTKNKRFAVVSIASFKTFKGPQGLFQMFTSNENIAGVDTQPLINKLSPRIVSTLGKSQYFSLAPEGAVLGSQVYEDFTEDPRVSKVLLMSDPMNVATKYKYVSEKEKFAKLANDLGVDGVIGITVVFGVSTGGGYFSLNGISLGKKTYGAMASIAAVAYNKKGEVVWKDSTLKEAEPSDTKAIIIIDTTNLTDTNFEALHPAAIEMGAKAMDVLLARFGDTMEGKSVSSIQSAK